MDDLHAELEASQKESRNYNSECFRLKAAWDETVEQLDVVKRENKNLADEIKDLLDQLGDGGRSIHDLDKQRRRLEQEKEELQMLIDERDAERRRAVTSPSQDFEEQLRDLRRQLNHYKSQSERLQTHLQQTNSEQRDADQERTEIIRKNRSVYEVYARCTCTCTCMYNVHVPYIG